MRRWSEMSDGEKADLCFLVAGICFVIAWGVCPVLLALLR